jgi:hypothetical protein
MLHRDEIGSEEATDFAARCLYCLKIGHLWREQPLHLDAILDFAERGVYSDRDCLAEDRPCKIEPQGVDVEEFADEWPSECNSAFDVDCHCEFLADLLGVGHELDAGECGVLDLLDALVAEIELEPRISFAVLLARLTRPRRTT